VVFKNSKQVNKAEVGQFVVLGLINSQLSSVMTWSMSLIIPNFVAKIISMGAIAVWNYLLMNFVIFKRK
jgi:putative flippase GtrA